LVLASLFVLVSSLAAIAQLRLEPPPANLKAAEQAGSPIGLTFNSVNDLGNDFKHLNYTVVNNSPRTIWGLVLTGIEGEDKPTLNVGAVLQPNEKRNFGTRLVITNNGSPQMVAVDFVLFRDGTFWGPDTAGEGEGLRGINEGQRAVITDVRTLLASNDATALRKLLTMEPHIPERYRMENRTKRQHGFIRGYGFGIMGLRLDLLGRGDLKGIPYRIAEMEENLGLATPPANDRRRQISRHYAFFEPVRIEEIFLGDKRVEVDEKFWADSDWLAGLRFLIKNNAGKNIVYSALSLEFPETTATGNIMVSAISYGRRPGSTIPIKDESITQTPVAAGDSFEMVLGEKGFGQLVKFLGSRHSLNDLRRVNIRISMIYFDDGTAWNGQFLKQDPNNPDRWIPIDAVAGPHKKVSGR